MIKQFFLFIFLFLVSFSIFAGSGKDLKQAECAKKLGTDTFIIAKMKELGWNEEQIHAQIIWEKVEEKEQQPLKDLIKRGLEWDGDMYYWFVNEIQTCMKESDA